MYKCLCNKYDIETYANYGKSKLLNSWAIDSCCNKFYSNLIIRQKCNEYIFENSIVADIIIKCKIQHNYTFQLGDIVFRIKNNDSFEETEKNLNSYIENLVFL